MLSLFGIVVGLALFILLAYIGYNTIIVAIAAGMVVAVFGGMNPFSLLSEAFMPKAVGFMQGYFLIFLFTPLPSRWPALQKGQKTGMYSGGWQLWYCPSSS